MASTKQTMKVEGLRELEQALHELPRATGGNVLKRAIAAPAADFADYLVTVAPSPGKIGSGKLKRSIRVGKPKIITPGKAAFAAAMQSGSTRAEAAQAARAANAAAGGTGRAAVTSVGPTKQAPEGMWEEFGSVHNTPHPWMRPAWDSKGPGMIGQIRDTLAKEIEKARQRLARKAARLAAKMGKTI